jgi:hypothetical protein
VIFSDALDLLKLLKADFPKPQARHMIIEIRSMQDKLKLKEKEIQKLVLTLRSIHDMLRFLPDARIRVEHISGKTNPADALTKILDVSLIRKDFLSRRDPTS